jgi:hypothetical protein
MCFVLTRKIRISSCIPLISRVICLLKPVFAGNSVNTGFLSRAAVKFASNFLGFFRKSIDFGVYCDIIIMG